MDFASYDPSTRAGAFIFNKDLSFNSRVFLEFGYQTGGLEGETKILHTFWSTTWTGTPTFTPCVMGFGAEMGFQEATQDYPIVITPQCGSLTKTTFETQQYRWAIK